METTEVSTDRRLDKENEVYRYNGMLFSFKKEGNPTIHNNVDEPEGYCAK